MARSLLSPADEVADLQSRTAAPFARAVEALIRARVSRDATAYAAAMDELAALLARVCSFSDLLGRRRMQLLADQAARQVPEHERQMLASFAVARLVAQSPLIPRVEFTQAVADILARTPEVAVGWRAAQEVYVQRRGFALAKSTDISVTERVQEIIAEAVRGGGKEPSPRQAIDRLGDWTTAYSDTVYENTVKGAYSAGMWAQTTNPAVARVIPGMRFVSALMVTTRPNHSAVHGLTASLGAQEWHTFGGALGHRCHCAVREVSIFEARRAGLMNSDGTLRTIYPPNFAKAGPDPGFMVRGRPDLTIGDV